MTNPLPSPWKDFLGELDHLLTGPLALHCMGGFVLVYFYGLPRTTGDIDYYSSIPSDVNLVELAGNGSALHKRHRVYLHKVTVTSLPEAYDTRLMEMSPGEFKNLRLLVPDPYDCILSKLDRNTSKDRDDAAYLFHLQKLDCQILRGRYNRELRGLLMGPDQRHDKTLDLWIDIFEKG
jgi:hypothetical protein